MHLDCLSRSPQGWREQAHLNYLFKEFAMFETGFAIFLGLVFIFIKLRRITMLRLLSHDMLLDVGVTLLTLLIHWGTFGGVMAATFAGLLTSVGTSAAKRAFGYVKGDVYVPGFIQLKV
jgi:hypothetical protein